MPTPSVHRILHWVASVWKMMPSLRSELAEPAGWIVPIVVGEHDRDQDGLVSQRGPHRRDVHQTVPPTGTQVT
jgi:hypothetical protein